MLSRFAASMTRRRLSPNTIRLRVFYVKKLAEHHDLLTATTTDLEAFVDSHPNWSENTQQSAVASLRTFYKWAVRSGYLTHNPTDDYVPITVHRRPSRIATDDKILNALAKADAVGRAMILLGAECGLRVSEIASLNTTHRDGSWLTITGKGDKVRSLYMSPELEDTLNLIEQTTVRHGNYFPGRHGTAQHPSTTWRHIRDLLGLNPHSLRHRAGTTVYRKSGNDLRMTQVFLGHSSSKTTEIYVHVERDDLVRASTASRLAA